ncbi:MAG: MAPEG family protein [Alphaproteobacteria bacterium]|nr:MAPEG family protein [Alphaproteobacteria bacterium]MBV9694214.1 MAPEG family protein [Alphaproteobacteria bacterium]
MSATVATLFTATVTVLALLVVFWTGFRVGGMRSKHNVQAPAVTGHPEFERAYRVQMNTLEQFVIFLPLLWLSNSYFMMLPLLTGALGLVWIVGRIVYALAYVSDPGSRGTGFIISLAATAGLLITTIVGLVNAWMAVTAG